MFQNKLHYKVDLHTHSIISHDGGITALEYEKVLTTEALDCIAITDHNETSFARIMQKKFGEKIIIGEEITTMDGEIIGLFLKETIPPGLSAEQTVALIHQQEALVYIPHPFETFRKGVQKSVLEKIRDRIDIFEVFNGRGIIRGKPKEAYSFAQLYQLASAASSDAHCKRGLGHTYSTVTDFPNKKSLQRLLSSPMLTLEYAPFYTLLCPTFNRIKNKIVLTNG